MADERRWSYRVPSSDIDINKPPHVVGVTWYRKGRCFSQGHRAYSISFFVIRRVTLHTAHHPALFAGWPCMQYIILRYSQGHRAYSTSSCLIRRVTMHAVHIAVLYTRWPFHVGYHLKNEMTCFNSLYFMGLNDLQCSIISWPLFCINCRVTLYAVYHSA